MFLLQIAEGSPIGQVPDQIEGYAGESALQIRESPCVMDRQWTQMHKSGTSRELGDKMESGRLGRWWNEHQSDMFMLLHW